MSDWRQSDSGKPTPKSKSKRKVKPGAGGPAPIPFVPRGTAPAKKKTGWRRGSKTAPAAPTGGVASRKWTGSAAEAETISGASMKKWLAVGFLAILASVLTVWFVREAFFQPQPLPLFVFSVGQYEHSEELLENPFGNHQRERLQAVNDKNLSARAATDQQEGKGNDKGLNGLRTSRWREPFGPGASDLTLGGGPSGDVVAFYVSAYAAFRGDKELYIYPQDGSPWNLADSKSALSLSDMLTVAAESVAEGKLAWVILDVQLPPLISNLGDLDPPWETAAEEAINRLEDDVRKRLLLTLPCGQGQQNWLAAEYSGSFFGHFLGELLGGKNVGTTWYSPDLTIGKFADVLNERVANAVSNRRYARQKPVWLPAENFDEASSRSLIRIARNSSTAPATPELPPAHLEKISQLWQRLNDDYQQAYRWDPLGYARVESGLLQLEETALHQPDSFLRAADSVEQAIQSLNARRPELALNVSVIEDAGREDYLRLGGSSRIAVRELAAQLASDLVDNSGSPRMPSFWKADSPAGGDAPRVAAGGEQGRGELQLAPNQRAYLVWRFYVELASTDRGSAWREAFRPDRLEQAVAFADSEAWLEMNLLLRFARDIDWSLPSEGREQMCARAIALFDKVQALATHPEPEVSWLLRSEDFGIPAVEKHFLVGFDWLLASDTQAAQAAFERAEATLRTLAGPAEQIAASVALAHQATQQLPHLLAWLLKEYEFASAAVLEQIQQQLQTLGRTAQLASDVHLYLSQRPKLPLESALVEATRELDENLSALQRGFTVYVDGKTNAKLTGGASLNPRSYRRCRIALLCPLLNGAARQRLHANTLEYLQTPDATRDQVDSTPLVRSTRQAAEEYFLPSITSQRERWRMLVEGDPRLQLESQFGQAAKPSSAEPELLRGKLLEIEFWHRVFASAFGHAPSVQRRLANSVAQGASVGLPWPWTAARQRWDLSAAISRLHSAQRLAEAKWGNGEFRGSSPDEDLYFYQLASKLRLPAGFDSASPVSTFADDFTQEMIQLRKSAAEQLKSLRTQFGSPNQTIPASGQQPATISIEGESLEAVAQVYLQAGSDTRTPWLPSKPEDRTWAADLRDAGQRSTRRVFQMDYWSPSSKPLGVLAIRGNVRREVIPWEVVENRQQLVELALERDLSEGSTVRVFPPRQLPRINVWLLIDCSESMDTRVPSTEGDNESVELFELVKKNAISILEELQKTHNEDAEVHVGLMLFGLGSATPAMAGLTESPEAHIHATKDSFALSADWLMRLEDMIESVSASQDTPLYNAIVYACESAQRKKAAKSFVYVLSDGVNLLNDKAFRTTKTASQVQESVRAMAGRLSIFHFDQFERWLATAKARNPNDDAAPVEQAYTNGIRELNSMKASMDSSQFGYYQSGDANRLLEESLKVIPRPMVTVRTASSATAKDYNSGPLPLGRRVEISREFLPAEMQIEVGGGPFSTAKLSVELLGGEEITLNYDGRGRFELPPFTDIGKLTCPSPSVANLSSEVYAKPQLDRIVRAGEIGIELHFFNGNTREITKRPRLVVAELSRTNDARAGSVVLADHAFRRRTEYPEAEFSGVPWPSAEQPARLRVWCADSLPAQFEVKTLTPQSSGEVQLPQATVKYAHLGQSVTAEIVYARNPLPGDRAVVICPDYEGVHRSIDQDTQRETCEFRLPESLHNKPVSLQISHVDGLVEAAAAGKVRQCVWERIN